MENGYRAEKKWIPYADGTSVNDSELTDRIDQLQAENEELTAEIEELGAEISLNQRLCGYE